MNFYTMTQLSFVKSYNIPFELQTWENLWHGWQFFPIQESQEAREKIVSFVKDNSYSSPK